MTPRTPTQHYDFSLFDNLPIGVCVFTSFDSKEPFQILSWSRTLEEWTGVPKKNAHGTSLLKQIPVLSAPEIIDQIQGAVKGKQVGSGASLLLFADGKMAKPVRFAKTKVRALRFCVNRVSADCDENLLMLSIEDVTESLKRHGAHKKTRRQTETEERIKVKYLNDLNHKIRIPINDIIGMCNLLSGTVSTPEQVAHLRVIQGCANALLEISYDFSTIPAERIKVESEPFPLHSAVTETEKQSFDREKFLEAFSGIEDIAESTLKTFILSLPQMLAAIEQATDTLDANAVEIAAHSMKGALAIFYAERARNLASKIEHDARVKSFKNIPQALSELKRELKNLEPVLRDLIPMKKSA